MRLLLDACVLYPTVIRNLLLNVSDELRWDINWSARILEEWRRASAKTNLEAEAQAEAEITMLKVKYPNASVNNFERHISKLYLPDQNDLHVLAAAIESNTNIIVTLNLRDFPNSELMKYGVRSIPTLLVMIGGEVVNKIIAAERGVAMVFQSYALYPHMTVFNNMAFALKQAKTPVSYTHLTLPTSDLV